MTTEAETERSLETIAREVMDAHTGALAASRTALEYAKRAGDLLLEVKGRLEHGEWLPWLAANCDLQPRTAQVYMQLAKGWSRLEEFRNAYPNTHLDIATARELLANGAAVVRADEADHDASEPQESVPADGTVVDAIEVASGGNDSAADKHIKKISLYFTTETLTSFRADLTQLAAYWGIEAATESDTVREVISRAASSVTGAREAA